MFSANTRLSVGRRRTAFHTVSDTHARTHARTHTHTHTHDVRETNEPTNQKTSVDDTQRGRRSQGTGDHTHTRTHTHFVREIRNHEKTRAVLVKQGTAVVRH